MDRTRLVAAINRLETPHQLVLEMRLVSDASFAEIGVVLNISERAAELLFEQAKAELRIILGGEPSSRECSA